jgi:hypothetical protein
MKKTVHLLILPLVLATFAYGQNQEEKLIRQTFDGYKSAILNDKGDEAVKYVDSRTIKYYGHIIELVKNADSTQVSSLSVMDKLMVFSIRHRTSREEILSFDGKALLVYAIKSGMVGKNGVAKNTIGKVVIDHEFAQGQFIVNGQESPLYFHFYKETGQWKLDLTSIFAASSMAIKNMVENSGQNENEYIFSILEALTGKKPGKEIWEKIQ